MDARRVATEHACERIPVGVRNFCGPVKLKDITLRIETRNGTSRFHRHAGMAAYGKIKRDDGLRRGECLVYVAIALAQAPCRCRVDTIEIIWRCISTETHGQFLDVNYHQLGGVFGEVGIDRENDCDRLTDVAYAILSEDWLAVGFKPFNVPETKIYRWNVDYINSGPHCNNTHCCERRTNI